MVRTSTSHLQNKKWSSLDNVKRNRPKEPQFSTPQVYYQPILDLAKKQLADGRDTHDVYCGEESHYSPMIIAENFDMSKDEGGDIFIKNPVVLISPDSLHQILPSEKMSLNQKLNASMRFAIILSILMKLMTGKWVYIYISVFMFIAIIYMKRNKLESFEQLANFLVGSCRGNCQCGIDPSNHHRVSGTQPIPPPMMPGQCTKRHLSGVGPLERPQITPETMSGTPNVSVSSEIWNQPGAMGRPKLYEPTTAEYEARGGGVSGQQGLWSVGNYISADANVQPQGRFLKRPMAYSRGSRFSYCNKLGNVRNRTELNEREQYIPTPQGGPVVKKRGYSAIQLGSKRQLDFKHDMSLDDIAFDYDRLERYKKDVNQEMRDYFDHDLTRKWIDVRIMNRLAGSQYCWTGRPGTRPGVLQMSAKRSKDGRNSVPQYS